MFFSCPFEFVWCKCRIEWQEWNWCFFFTFNCNNCNCNGHKTISENITSNNRKLGGPVICTGSLDSVHNNHNITWDNKADFSNYQDRFAIISSNDLYHYELSMKSHNHHSRTCPYLTIKIIADSNLWSNYIRKTSRILSTILKTSLRSKVWN